MTERTLLTTSGQPIRAQAVRGVTVGVAVLAAAWLLALTGLGDVDFGWPAVWVGLSIAVAHATVYLARLEPDSHNFTGEELPVVAALVLLPDAVPAGLLIAAAAVPLAARRFALLGRMRTASPEKLLFNGASVVLGGACGVTATATALGASVPRPLAGLLGGLAYYAVTALATAAVIVAASGRPAAEVALRVTRRSWGASLVLAVAGAVFGVLFAQSPVPGLAVLAVTIGLYVLARSRMSTWRAAEARDRILREVPHVLANEGDLDAATLETARRLLGCREARLSTRPPARTELGVPLEDDGGRTYLVVGDRVGEHRSFDVEDLVLLENLASLAGSARQHRSTLDRLRRSEETRAAITGALAHDLRSPLSTVSAGLETLHQWGPDLDPVTHAELLGVAATNVARALAILDDLLALERLATDPLTSGAADVAAAVRAVAAAHEGAVEIRDGAPVLVSLDQRVLERILDNLVGNARKHAPGSPVAMAWTVDPAGVVITVDDRGAGIPQHLRETLTGPFQQGDARVTGVGLGLHLARRFTELAGGRLEIDDVPDGGASVRIVLPTVGASDDDAGSVISSGKRPSSP